MSTETTIRMVLALQEGPKTRAELVSITGMNEQACRAMLKRISDMGYARPMGYTVDKDTLGKRMLWKWKP